MATPPFSHAGPTANLLDLPHPAAPLSSFHPPPDSPHPPSESPLPPPELPLSPPESFRPTQPEVSVPAGLTQANPYATWYDDVDEQLTQWLDGVFGGAEPYVPAAQDLGLISRTDSDLDDDAEDSPVEDPHEDESLANAEPAHNSAAQSAIPIAEIHYIILLPHL